MGQQPPQQHRHLLQSPDAVNFIAGLLGGFISVTVCNPLDIARSRLNVVNAPAHKQHQGKYIDFFHTLRTIWKEEGLRGFYAGYRTNVVAIPIFHSLFFPIFEAIKRWGHRRGQSDTQARLCATVGAGVSCNILTNPIWVVRTRLMVQYLHHESNQYQREAPFHVMRQMIKKEGFLSLYKGLGASVLSVVNAVVYFQIYERLKEVLPHKKEVSPLHIFFCSTAAKILASSLTYPIVVMRTVLFDVRGKGRLWPIARHIWQDRGVRGFYAGLRVDLLRLIPSNAILFVVYEEAKHYL